MPSRPPRAVATVTKERDVFMYSELWHASEAVLTKGINDSLGRSWQFLSSIVLTAFSFEAYLNHVGEQNFKTWDGLERLRTRDKFLFLCEMLKVNFSQGNGDRPLQTIYQLLDFRNEMAHGKSTVLKPKSETVELGYLETHLMQRPMARWEQLIRDDVFAKRAREDVAAVLTAIQEMRPEPKEHLFTFGIGASSAAFKIE
jgi:hypothetical protein